MNTIVTFIIAAALAFATFYLFTVWIPLPSYFPHIIAVLVFFGFGVYGPEINLPTRR